MTLLLAASLGLLLTQVPAAPASRALSALADEASALFYEGHPCRATQDGIHTFDRRMLDLSPAFVKSSIKRWGALLIRLHALKPDRMNLDDQVDFEALDGFMRADRFELEERKSWRNNPMPYIQGAGECIDNLMKRNFAPPEERIRLATARLAQVATLLAEGEANILNPPAEFVEVALRQSRDAIPFFRDAVPKWAHENSAADAGLRREFDAAAASATQAVIHFAEWVEHDLKPRAKGSFVLGPELFSKKLLYEEGVKLPLPELLARGEAQLQKDYDAFIATARILNPALSPHAVMDLQSADHPTQAQLLPRVRETLNATRAFVVAKDIASIPSQELPNVQETPPFLRGGSFASMDAPGPYETRATESFYYITPTEPGWTAKHKEEHLKGFNVPELSLITLHEVFPGHFLQLLYSRQFPTKVRKLVASNTNVEGWAHYSEQMMVDQGFGNGDPKIRLAQLQQALLRDCRYVGGMKMHTQGMSLADATRLFVDRCFEQPANAYEEARRGTFDPIYLYYTFGKLEIQDLAREYLAKSHRRLKDFHDAFIARGPLPVPLVRRLLLSTAEARP